MKNIARYILFSLLGVLIGASTVYLLLGNNKTIIKTGYDSKFEPVFEAYETIKNEYYKDIDDSKLIDGMINGIMLATEDKHTMFFNEEPA